LEPGLLLVDFFAVRKKELIEYEDKTRLELELGDKTGRIDAVVWHNAEAIYKMFDIEDVVKIKGKVTTYGKKFQIAVKRIRKATPEEYDPADFLPRTEKELQKLKSKLKDYIASVENPPLKALLNTIFTADFTAQFLESPAGKLWHHRYIGGLAEHTLNVASFCEKCSELYHELVNRDLLITAALIHDMGKVSAYKISTYFDYSDSGRLIGHLSLGDEMLMSAINQIPDFPESLKMKLRHLILSHHGNHETGSPTLPQIPEAFVLHFADNLDSTMGAVARIKNETVDSDWSKFVRILERFLYFG
jgi:3'-5' exoribonuclease